MVNLRVRRAGGDVYVFHGGVGGGLGCFSGVAGFRSGSAGRWLVFLYWSRPLIL